jgi:hypothetical protein
MLKLALLLYFALLYYTHVVSDLATPLDQPLSVFREGQFGRLGYAIFCTIALIGVLYAFDLRRIGQPAEAANTLVALILLLIVVATPSPGLLHNLTALLILASLFMYYAVLLYRAGARPYLIIHLAVPILLAAVFRFHSYGIWQKALIGYFIVAAVIHAHIATRAARRPPAPEPDVFYKDRKTYNLTPAPTWPRRKSRS